MVLEQPESPTKKEWSTTFTSHSEQKINSQQVQTEMSKVKLKRVLPETCTRTTLFIMATGTNVEQMFSRWANKTNHGTSIRWTATRKKITFTCNLCRWTSRTACRAEASNEMSHSFLFHLAETLEKTNLICSAKQTSGGLRPRNRMAWPEGAREHCFEIMDTFTSRQYCCYTGVCVCQNPSSRTFKIGISYCI